MTFTLVYAIMSGLLNGCLYGLVAVGFVAIYKSAKFFNFAQGDFITVGALIVFLAYHEFGLSVVTSLVLGLLGISLVALFINDYVMEKVVGHPPVVVILVTVGLGIWMRGLAGVFLRVPDFYIPLPIPEDPPLLVDFGLSYVQFINAGIAIVCVCLVHWFFAHSRTGIALRAISDDHVVASSMGIDVREQMAVTWIISGLTAVVAGVLWGNFYGFGVGIGLLGLKVFPVVIIGGLDSIPGVLVGGLFVGLSESLVAAFLDPVIQGGSTRNFTPFLIMIAFLMFRPYGFFGREQIDRV